jgi:DNA helicase-2/ATP-dependent DNA helicase PcrA
MQLPYVQIATEKTILAKYRKANKRLKRGPRRRDGADSAMPCQRGRLTFALCVHHAISGGSHDAVTFGQHSLVFKIRRATNKMVEVTLSIDNLINDLNDCQRAAATYSGIHALVLAGAGTGKTRTIIARAGYLVHSGVSADRIQILTFTRRSAKEIVERVKMNLGNRADPLNASTFHTWCMTLIRRMPKLFGCVGSTVIDRDDQLQLFKRLRGSDKNNPLPPAAMLCDIYSYARNTRLSLTKTLELLHDDLLPKKEKIADVARAYEVKKRERNYLDYDDILDVVAAVLKQNHEVRSYVSQHYDHILVDEMQDTNPLQWDLLEPLRDKVKLFCVGDDAQSIYGFRGADFRNVHSFTQRVPDSVVLRLEQNYRSTQEILDLSNWLLAQSPIGYNKRLVAVRGAGHKPRLLNFVSEWDEARWIADDIARRRGEGTDWAQHMILTRSGFAARAVETTLLARDIPYRFIGGTKLLESAHIRDILSVLRIVANPKDELAWVRFLTLWPKIGDVTANHVIEQFPTSGDLSGCMQVLNSERKLPEGCKLTVSKVAALADAPGEAFLAAKAALWPILEHSYAKDWDRRRGDFSLVEKLVKRHTSILAFIEEYLLDPVYSSKRDRTEEDDLVTIITIHSAKGTEKPVCYVINVSPGSFPSSRAIDNADEVEEERRVLYVALTRAQNELILTRHSYELFSSQAPSIFKDSPEFNALLSQIRLLNVERAQLIVLMAEKSPNANNSDQVQLLKKRFEEIEVDLAEIGSRKDELEATLRQIHANDPPAPAAYFLNPSSPFLRKNL